jgi:putative addiction module CopG family antidote
MSIPPWALHTTMHVDHSPEMETCIKRKIAIGLYGNTTAVIRYAFRRMRTEEERVLKDLH